jgi:hypothetical protein
VRRGEGGREKWEGGREGGGGKSKEEEGRKRARSEWEELNSHTLMRIQRLSAS